VVLYGHFIRFLHLLHARAVFQLSLFSTPAAEPISPGLHRSGPNAVMTGRLMRSRDFFPVRGSETETIRIEN
jgi:hypothetical protein